MILAFSPMDIIKVPFGYIMEWLYQLTSNYGVSLILFSLIVKLILLYPSAKGKKGMMKMTRLNPQLKKLEAKYGDDKKAYQDAMVALYKAEGVKPTGGCLWSLLPLLRPDRAEIDGEETSGLLVAISANAEGDGFAGIY